MQAVHIRECVSFSVVDLASAFARRAFALFGLALFLVVATIASISTAYAQTLNCNGTIYALSGSGLYAVNPTNGATSLIGNFTNSGNALGISKDGTKAYAVVGASGTTVTIGVYNAAAGTATTVTGTGDSAVLGYIAGGVDPTTGIFYYMEIGQKAPGTATIFAYNFTTNTNIGQIATVTGFPTNSNGDIVFDANGNLYFTGGAGVTGNIKKIAAPLPTTASTTRTLTTTTLVTNASLAGTNGIAFDNLGNLYVGSTGGINPVNMNTGAIGAAQTFTPTISSTDLASCVTPPTLTVKKNFLSRINTTDEVQMAIAGPGTLSNTSAVTTGSSPGLQAVFAGPVIAVAGSSYTITETGTSGANLANYATTYSCVDTNFTPNTVISSGALTPVSGTNTINLTFPTPSNENGPNIVCTFANGSPPTLKLAKTSINAVGTFTFALTGVTTTTDTITTATSGTAVNSATTHTGTASTAATITETAPSGFTTTSYSCVDANAASDGNGSASPISGNTTAISIPGANMVPGAAWTCSYTNVQPLSCGSITVYGLNQGTVDTAHGVLAMVPNSANTTVASTLFGSFGDPAAILNGLGIAPGGTAAYAVQQLPSGGVVAIYQYLASTGVVSTLGTVAVNSGDISFALGGVDPVNGWFYIASYNANAISTGNGGFNVYAFNPATGTSQGLQFKMAYAPSAGTTFNGDLAFDAQGRMYAVLSAGDGVAADNQLVEIDAPLPTGGAQATLNLLSNPAPAANRFTGIAFGSNGYLYLSANPGGGIMLYQINPDTGAIVGNPMMILNPNGTDNQDMGDLASCAYPSTITLQKNIAGRAVASDQFTLTISGNGLGTGNTSGTTSGNTLGMQTAATATAGPVIVLPTLTYSIAEAGVLGANLANYSIAYSCTDTTTNTVIASGSGTPGMVTVPNDGASGANVMCTFTNTPLLPPTVMLAKTSINAIGTFTFALTGVTTTTDTITTATSGTAVNSAATHTGTAGTAATITETAPSSFTTTSYNCVDANAASDGNGSASPISGSTTAISIPGANMVPGAAWTCSYTNVQPLSCGGSTIYTLQRGATTVNTGNAAIYSLNTAGLGATVTDTLVTTAPTGSGFTNGLGVGLGGTSLYMANQSPTSGTTGTVWGYNAVTGVWTAYTTATIPVGNALVAGAVDPANGIYYYASYTSNSNTAVLYGFNTLTNTPISGPIATITFPLAATGANPNGDIAFDAAGNLYVLTQISNTAVVGIVQGPLPTTGINATPTVTTLSTFAAPIATPYGSLAFDNQGHMFVQYSNASNQSFILEINPNTGAASAGPAQESLSTTFPSVDLGSCAFNPTLTLQKNVVSRLQSSDQFVLSVTPNGGSASTVTTNGPSTGNQTNVVGPLIGVSNTSYAVAESATNNNLAAYSTSYACVDTANGNSSVAAGNTQSFNLTFPTPTAGQNSPQVVCTFSNGPIPNVSITKTDANGGAYTPGGTNTYTITVSNTGGAVAGVTAADVLPKGVTLTSPWVCSPAADCTAGCTVSGASCNGNAPTTPFTSDGATNVLNGLLLSLPNGSVVTITLPVMYANNPAAY